jgi:hypothetical protein
MSNGAAVLAIKVKFELFTPNGLRHVIFGLQKDTKKTEKVVVWQIHFQLFERKQKTDPWGDAIVTLDVEVDKELHDKAEKTSKKKAMSAGQTAHALGPAADDAKAADAGEIEQDEADRTVKNTLKQ